MKNDKAISESVTFETEPAETSWGERFFHVRESDSYQLSFAHPLERKSLILPRSNNATFMLLQQ